ncbi:MAG TPA: GNAT family N-acetyltransferase [Solirubrobacteraceae bacterium]|nr:GNAT family N-acetyltransferase [Solirubrobacteraceae bacterium]
MLEVSLATIEDAGAIAAVKTTGWRTTYSAWVPDAVLAPFLDVGAQTDAIASELAQPPNFAVIAREDRVLGFATCLFAGRDEPLLDSLHVLPEARGRGVGSALLSRVAVEVEQRGARSLVVEVVKENVRTRRLYERLGARYVGTAPAAWAPEVVREALYRWDDLAGLRVGQENRR